MVKKALIAGFAVLALAAGAAFALFPERKAPEALFASTAELRGKVVLVNFWATWCGVCIQEMPKLVETHKKFAERGYDTVAVAVNRDDPEKVARFAEQRKLPFRVVYDSTGGLADHFGGVRITPLTFVIDKQGRVLKKYTGEPDWAELHQLVDQALRY